MSYKNYFKLLCKRTFCFSLFLKNFKNIAKIGSFVRLLYTATPVFSIELSAFMKAGGYPIFSRFFEIDTFEYYGVCIAIKKNFFGSSFKLRAYTSGFLVDRLIHFFSPKLVYIYGGDLGGIATKKGNKAKLFFVKGRSNRALFFKSNS